MAIGGALPDPAPFDRARALARLGAERFDVVVVGGGVTGCGVAVDAAARGLRVALVEAGDFAEGTSSRSSKLVHGGLRYLAHGEHGLVREALAERQRLLANAAHLVRPLPFLVPVWGQGGLASASVVKAYAAALWTYDLAGGQRIGHRHGRIGADAAGRHVPPLRTDGLAAVFEYWDAQADDARLTLTLARTAAALGAVVANRCPVAGHLRAGSAVGGVVLVDGTEVRARAVVNAAGVWSAAVAGLPGAPAGAAPGLRPAKGVHVTVRADRLPCDRAVVLPVPGERRSVFVVPWWAPGGTGTAGPGRFTYIGTTDTDWHGPLDEPACDAGDIDGLLAAVNAWTDAGLRPGDVTGTWAGLRPLLAAGGTDRSADLSRRHTVVADPSGLVTVTGGKLTTYRRMAADAVDAVEQVLGVRHRPSPTAELRLHAAIDHGGTAGGAGVLADPGIRAHLVGRFGCEAPDVAALCDADGDLSKPLVAGMPYLRAEVVWAARHEMAGSVADVLARRTRALILDREAAAAAATDTAGLLAGELGWDAGRTAVEVDAFTSIVEREAAASRRPAGVAR